MHIHFSPSVLFHLVPHLRRCVQSPRFTLALKFLARRSCEQSRNHLLDSRINLDQVKSLISQKIAQPQGRGVAGKNLCVLLRHGFSGHIIQHQGHVCAWHSIQLEWNTVRQD